ncbi:transmembrane 9 superfamily member 2-like [Salvelinus alpinus]|uniref:transmembrane 9 superfamily member 2-like n=1 Tax=Salvelinus alpinus TaxID=8036 RepID=UPI0039FC54C5
MENLQHADGHLGFVVWHLRAPLLAWAPSRLRLQEASNQVRQIHENSFIAMPMPSIVLVGVLPFGCIFIQLFFILKSIW